MIIFSGNANKPLAEEIVEHLGVKLGDALITTFSDGEVRVEILENVRGKDVFVIQPTAPPARNVMELVLMIDALKRASARRITAVIPYYGYGRQDRKAKPRVPISARVLADMVQNAGTDRVLTMDLHSPQIQGFFRIPVDNLYCSKIFLPYIRANFSNYIEEGKFTLVSPDAGGTDRVRYYKDRIEKASLAIIDKRREEANIAHAMHVVGNVSGKVAMILDDMVDTAGTMCEAAEALVEHEAIKVVAIASHAVLSGPAIERINSSPIEKIILTNSIHKHLENDKFLFISVAGLISEGIRRIHEEESVSGLFD